MPVKTSAPIPTVSVHSADIAISCPTFTARLDSRLNWLTYLMWSEHMLLKLRHIREQNIGVFLLYSVHTACEPVGTTKFHDKLVFFYPLCDIYLRLSSPRLKSNLCIVSAHMTQSVVSATVTAFIQTLAKRKLPMFYWQKWKANGTNTKRMVGDNTL